MEIRGIRVIPSRRLSKILPQTRSWWIRSFEIYVKNKSLSASNC